MHDASAVMIAAEDAPVMCKYGQWVSMSHLRYSAAETETLARALLSAEEWEEFERNQVVEVERWLDGPGAVSCEVILRGQRIILEIRVQPPGFS